MSRARRAVSAKASEFSAISRVEEVELVEADQRWMRRALALARRGRGATRPNPMVGAVVVRGGRLLGQGFHRRAGTPHAEINALAGLGRRAAGATLYVTLEPCCHTGRTAPCTTAVIAAGLARVVVGVRDPNPLVNGRGIAQLRRAGIRVEVAAGKVAIACRELNRPFFTWIQQHRPLVTLKVAASLDGFIADGRSARVAAPVWITGREARAATHALRSQHDAILIGAGTVRADNPLLTVRLPQRRIRGGGETRAAAPLLRVILDGGLTVPSNAAVLAPAPGARTLVVGTDGASARRAARLRQAGAEVQLLPSRYGRIDMKRLLTALAERAVQSLLVEGGAEVHAAFIAAGLVDRVAFFYAPSLLGGGVPIAAGGREGGRRVSRALRLGPLAVRRLGADILVQADVIAEP